MLQLCIDMVKTRVGMMQQDYRKTFLTIVTALIEKSPVGGGLGQGMERFCGMGSFLSERASVNPWAIAPGLIVNHWCMVVWARGF